MFTDLVLSFLAVFVSLGLYVLYFVSSVLCLLTSWCHCHSLSLASVKSRPALSFWFRLTLVVPDKGPLNGCCCSYCCFVFATSFVLDSVFSVLDKRLAGRYDESGT